jgi:hypothetical protein
LVEIEVNAQKDGEEKRAEVESSGRVDYSEVSKLSFVVVREWVVGGLGFPCVPVK